MSYYIVHNNSKSLKHAAPYSTPNSGKRLLARWTAKNLRVFQETPGNVNSGIFASFDLVNANNPKEKTYNMQFSFADGTSADKNIIARIRRFFNNAYNRQRGYGFPELTEMEKQQIVAKINTAYNQWSGFSHSVDEPDVIDCMSDSNNYLEHSSARLQSVFKYTTEQGKHVYIPDRMLTDKADHIGVAFYSSKDNGINVYVPINQLSNKDQIKVKFALGLRNKDSKATIVPGTDDLMADLIAGRLSLSHSDDLNYPNYLEHHGILGMKWGVRRFQNADGSLTDAGRKRYGLGDPEYQRKKGIKTTEEVAQTINRLNSGKEIAKDVYYFNSSTGNENDFKTGEAHARAVQNYANYLSDSIHNYRKMLASRMPKNVSDAYISHLLEQEVKWLNQQSRDEGVRIIYKLDTSGGLNNADFKVEFMYPDQRKIK